MQAGRLRHRVQIQEPTVTVGSAGGAATAYTTICTRWASVEPVSGREGIAADQASAIGIVRVWLRYFDGLTSQHRILFGTRTLNIISVINTKGRGAMYEVLCEEDV